MPLTNKYLKYSPEITLEIFEKIWNKLLEVYKVSYPDDLETRFEEFTRGESISLSYDGELGLYLMYSSETKTETTVQEILGYDPFIKEGELDSNKIYHGRIKNYGGYIIFKPNTYELFSQNGDIPNSFSTGNYPSQVIGAVIATKEEWEWLELCISNNKFMEKPFVEEFVLPKSWCLRTTPETDKILCEWRGGGHCSDTKDSLLVYDSESTCPRYWENIKKIDKYQEITFNQFKKYVLKEPVEKEVIPEYVECIKDTWSDNDSNLGKIFKIEIDTDRGRYIPGYCIERSHSWNNNFKPSTKEAFDAQNKPKSIEKWSVGSYVVAIKDGIARSKPKDSFKIGFIDEIDSVFNNSTIGIKFSSNCCDKSDFKWFATKIEAEEFAKTLVEPVKEEVRQPLKQAVHCKTQEEWDFVQDKIGNDSNNWFADENWGNNRSFCVSFEGKNQSQTLKFYQDAGYQILSFQEWCQQNGYLMENKCEFKIGKYYRFNIGKSTDSSTRTIRFAGTDKDRRIIADLWLMDSGKKFTAYKNSWNKSNVNNPIELSIEEIQQYLPDGHPDKIQLNPEFKVGDWVTCTKERVGYNGKIGKLYQLVEIKKESLKFDKYNGLHPTEVGVRHATPEEINNHLISIGQIPAEPICTNTNSHRHDGCGERYGCIQNCNECDYNQIPAGEPIGCGIEPDKNNVFKYTTAYSNTSNNWSTRMDCGESVAKISEQIKLNYLPEPK